MIGTIRKTMQKRGAKIILWLTLFSLGGGGFMTLFRFSRRFKSDSVARVNDQQISFSEFKRKFAETQHIVREVRRMYGPQADMVLQLWGLDKSPDEFALQSLIGEKVAQSAADALNVQVSNEYVQSKLRDPLFVRQYLGNIIPPQASAGGSLDVVVLKHALQSQNISEEQFDQILRDTMKRALLQRLVESSLYIPRSILKTAYEREYLKRKFALLRLPMSDSLKQARAEKVSDAELEKYFDTHREDYRIPEKRSARLWTFDADTFGVQVHDKDIESAYHKRKRASYIEKPEEFQVQHILLTFDKQDNAKKIEVRRTAQEILKQAKEKPDSFEALATKYSQSKDKGTTITLKRTGRESTFEQAAFSLAPQEISPVVETTDGFEILKLVAKKEPVFKPLSAVKEPLTKALKQEKFAAEFNTNAQRVISQAADLPEIFTTFITERKGKESKLDAATRDGSVKMERLFGLSKPGNKAFFEEEGKGFIIELIQTTPSALPSFVSVKEKVLQDFSTKKARQALEAEVHSIRTRMRDGKKSLQEVAKGREIVTTDWINPQSAESLKKLEEQKLPAQKMFTLTKVGDSTQDITQDGGYIIELIDRESFDQADFEKKRASLEMQLRQEESSQLQRSFMDALKARAKVDINTDLLRVGGR